MTTSWRTTLSGIAILVTTIGGVMAAIADGRPVEVGSTLTGIGAGIGLILAEDHRTARRGKKSD